MLAMWESGSGGLSPLRYALWRVFRALGELSLIATAFVLLARIWWFFELFSHFRMQLLATQCVLLIAFLVLRRPMWALIIGAVGVINGVAVRDYLVPVRDFAGAEDRAVEIRVLTANVLASNSDPAKFVDLIEAEEPDVFAVLEFTQTFAEALDSLTENYPNQILIPQRGPFGIAVYSRWPIVGRNVLELEGITGIDAEIMDARGAWHFIAEHHVPPMNSDMAALRNRQLVRLGQYVNTIAAPRVVVGDFNITPFSPWFRDFAEQTTLENALRGRGPSYSWPEFFPLLGIPIDHVLVSPEFTVVDYHRAGDIGSDHFPVIVDMIRSAMSLD